MKQWNNGAMILKSLYLQNFRSYKDKKFDFSPKTTIIVGKNTSGKTNLCEAISYLSTGKSFRTKKDEEAVEFDKEIGRVGGAVESSMINDQGSTIKLEVVLVNHPSASSGFTGRFSKKFFVNGVSKSRQNFLGFLPSVIFHPEDLDIIIDGPSLRRDFLDNILEQVDRDYYHAMGSYMRALRQRNALLDRVRELGIRNKGEFEYWDNLLITNGQIITQKREELIEFFNKSKKEIIDFETNYDKSTISKERLLQYKDAEVGAGVTLVGPHRDDLIFLSGGKDVRWFGSRGQERLVILQLKILQIKFIKERTQNTPILILDDIFSELDSSHIELVFSIIGENQTIITTTHKEFISKNKPKDYSVIEL